MKEDVGFYDTLKKMLFASPIQLSVYFSLDIHCSMVATI